MTLNPLRNPGALCVTFKSGILIFIWYNKGHKERAKGAERGFYSQSFCLPLKVSSHYCFHPHP